MDGGVSAADSACSLAYFRPQLSGMQADVMPHSAAFVNCAAFVNSDSGSLLLVPVVTLGHSSNANSTDCVLFDPMSAASR